MTSQPSNFQDGQRVQPVQPEQPTRMEPAAQPGQPGDPGTVVIRERKKSRKRKSKKKARRVPLWAKVLVGVVAVLALSAAGAFAFVNYNVSKGEKELHEPTVEETARTVTYAGHTYRYNDDVVPILVLGKDDESNYGTDRACTDANMLVTLDTATKELKIIAIPRDSMVDVDLYRDNVYTRTAVHQLAVAYGVDVATEEQCARNTLKSVTELFYGMPIENYFVLELAAVPELSSAVGGVKVEALDTYPGAEFQAGDTVLLEGEAALKYVRYRDVNVDRSAQDRQARQVQFVQAFLQKLRTSDIGTVLDLYNTVQRSTYTNLELSDISYLASVFLDGKDTKTEFITLTGTTKLESDDDGVEREHIYLDEDGVMEAMLAAFYTRAD